MPTTTSIDLAKLETYAEVKKYLTQAVVNIDDSYAAMVFIDNLERMLAEQNIREKNAELYENYSNLIIQAKLIALPLLLDREVLEVIEKYLVRAFDFLSYDFKRKINTKLLGMPLFSDRQEFKKKARMALEKNEEILTIEGIIEKNEALPGTTANWLKNYRREVLSKKGAGKLERLEYLNKNSNVNRLSAEDKKKLQAVIELYDELRISVFSPEGVETPMIFRMPDGSLKIFNKGIFEQIKKEEIDKLVEKFSPLGFFKAKAGLKILKQTAPQKTAELVAEMRKKLEGGKMERDSIDKELQSLAKIAKDEEAIVSYLKRSLESKDKVKVLSALYLLAREGKLPRLLETNAFFSKIIKQELKKQGLDEKKYNLNSAAPEYLKLFLRYIFETTLLLPAAESARLALRLAEFLARTGHQEYRGLVFYDVKSKEFSWL